MKGLAEVKLLPRCLQLRTQRRRPGTTEDETADLTYTPLDVALLCCNAPVVYDILRRAGSSCFQNLPTNKGNALHNAVRGGNSLTTYTLQKSTLLFYEHYQRNMISCIEFLIIMYSTRILSVSHLRLQVPERSPCEIQRRYFVLFILI